MLVTVTPDPAVERDVDADAPSTRHRWRGRPLAAVRAIPFTALVVAAMLIAGVASGTLWHSLSAMPLSSEVSYGLPAFEAGRWATLVTGLPFAREPWHYAVLVVVVIVLVGFAELRLGTRRAVALTLGLQVGSVLAAAGLIAVLRTLDWTWADYVAGQTSVSLWPGAVGAASAATVTLHSPWRARVRAFLVLSAVLLLLYEGLLGDIETAIAVVAGLLAGPLLKGRLPRPGLPRLTRREWRLVAAATFVVTAAVRVVVLVTPDADAPLRMGDGSPVDWTQVLFGVALPLALAEGLRRGRRPAWRIAVTLAALATLVEVLAVGALSAVLLGANLDVQVGGDVWGEYVADAVLWLFSLSVLLLGRAAFRGTPRRSRREAARTSETDRDAARRVLHEVGGGRLSWMTTWEGNFWQFAADGTGYVAYQPRAGIALALGDPVAPDPSARGAMADQFVDATTRDGLEPCFFSVTAETAQWAHAHGWHSVRVAEEAVIALPGLEFKGKHWQDVRSALNRATKEGVQFRLGTLSAMPRGIITQVRAISEEWVGDKGLPEMGFTLGGVDEALDPEVRVGLAVDGEGTVHGVTSWLPVLRAGGGAEGWTLDVMRRLPDGFRPVTEFLIASSCVAFRDEGASFASLSGAPLAGDPDEHPDAGNLDRLLAWLGEQMEPLYGFRSLDSFKAKFSPRHEPLFLVYREEAALPRIGIALTRAYLPDASLFDLASAGLRARG